MNISPWMASSIRWRSLEVDSSSELWNFVLTWQLYSLLVYTFTACTGAETDKTSIFLLLQGSFQQASQFGSLQWICFDYINKCALRPSCSNFRCFLKHCPISSGHLSLATFTLEKQDGCTIEPNPQSQQCTMQYSWSIISRTIGRARPGNLADRVDMLQTPFLIRLCCDDPLDFCCGSHWNLRYSEGGRAFILFNNVVRGWVGKVVRGP